MTAANENLKAAGRRLGQVVAMYPNGKKGAMAAAGISHDTLDRYLNGESSRMPIIPVANICKPHNINLTWLIWGEKYAKYDNRRQHAAEPSSQM